MLLIDIKNKLLREYELFERNNESFKQQYRDARKNLRHAAQVDKGKWTVTTVKKISDMSNSPIINWENIKTLTKGHKSHYQTKKSV